MDCFASLAMTVSRPLIYWLHFRSGTQDEDNKQRSGKNQTGCLMVRSAAQRSVSNHGPRRSFETHRYAVFLRDEDNKQRSRKNHTGRTGRDASW